MYVEQRHGICEHCKNAKDKRGAACYCVQYGIIIGYPKDSCRGFERGNNNIGSTQASKPQ